MAKPLRKVIKKPKHDPEMVKDAIRFYSDAEPDLPRHGRHHYHSAHDYVSDRLYDKYNKAHPKVDFRKVARHALKFHVSDDRKESRANDLNIARARIRAARPPKEAKETRPPVKKARRGIGSY